MTDSEIIPRSELERVFQDAISFRDDFSLGRVTEGYGVVRFIKSRFSGPLTIGVRSGLRGSASTLS